jgi:hypothetical protein
MSFNGLSKRLSQRLRKEIDSVEEKRKGDLFMRGRFFFSVGRPLHLTANPGQIFLLSITVSVGTSH